MTYLPCTNRGKNGFALLLSIIIASVVLAIGVSIMKISVSQLQLSATSRESEIAFQASQSIADCFEFWRYGRNDAFTARPGTLLPPTRLNAPPIRCMGSAAEESYAEVIENSDAGHIIKFHYQFNWGTDPALCSTGDMYIMKPNGQDLQETFRGLSVGDNGDGNKTCTAGAVCTMLVTQGYNRPCNELQSSIFTVQRELTTEF